jgi:beta-phosphoglucomutase
MENQVAFLFDMDGVIVDSNPVHKIALLEFCRKHGYDLNEDQLREKIYGRTNKDWIPAVFGDIPRARVKQYADEKEALFRDLYAATIRPVDGLIDFLRRIQKKFPVAIATSAPRENVDFTLAGTGTGHFFDVILDESFVEKGKPDPEIYLKTAAAVGFPPGRCVVFEDSLSGVSAGKAAGCKVVALTTTHTTAELADADLVIENFVGLEPLELISELF